MHCNKTEEWEGGPSGGPGLSRAFCSSVFVSLPFQIQGDTYVSCDILWPWLASVCVHMKHEKISRSKNGTFCSESHMVHRQVITDQKGIKKGKKVKGIRCEHSRAYFPVQGFPLSMPA